MILEHRRNIDRKSKHIFLSPKYLAMALLDNVKQQVNYLEVEYRAGLKKKLRRLGQLVHYYTPHVIPSSMA